MKRIVINNCINFLRKKKLDLVELQEGYHDRAPEKEPLPRGLSVDAVKNALMDLPHGYRVIFSLYAMEGYDHSEIAQILDISESTSKSQYSRAKMKLRQVLKSDAFINL
jgi:RNA polymerase sigma-70 factor (ECF subfamily)